MQVPNIKEKTIIKLFEIRQAIYFVIDQFGSFNLERTLSAEKRYYNNY